MKNHTALWTEGKRSGTFSVSYIPLVKVTCTVNTVNTLCFINNWLCAHTICSVTIQAQIVSFCMDTSELA